MIVDPRLLPFGGRPAVGFGPKLEEMNPRTFPDLPIRPRTLDFDQKASNITTNKSKNKLEKSKKVPYDCLILPNNSYRRRKYRRKRINSLATAELPAAKWEKNMMACMEMHEHTTEDQIPPCRVPMKGLIGLIRIFLILC